MESGFLCFPETNVITMLLEMESHDYLGFQAQNQPGASFEVGTVLSTPCSDQEDTTLSWDTQL